jgi:hypothetical protein
MNIPPLDVVNLGIPVSSMSYWATAIARRPQGSYTFITQFYLYPTSDYPSYALVAIDPTVSDEERVVEARQVSFPPQPPGAYGYTNGRYQWNTQVLAANDRVFFAEWGGEVAYYDPVDEGIHHVGLVSDPERDVWLISFAFDRDGFLYGGTQTKSSANLPLIVRIDRNVHDPPQPGEVRSLGRIAGQQGTYSYAYNLAVDPPWVYVALGQSPWQVSAIHADTGETRLLADPDGPDRYTNEQLALPTGVTYIGFETNLHPEVGIVAKLIYGEGDSLGTRRYWCADGELYTYNGYPASLPFTARGIAPRTGDKISDIELDLSELTPKGNGQNRRGTSVLKWRTAGPNEPYRRLRFDILTTPVPIESLLSLPDDTLLGNASDYHGFFRHYPGARTEHYGAWKEISRGPRVNWNGRVYISGYPQSRLFRYNPAESWSEQNPRLLGQFRRDDLDAARGSGYSTGTHYADFLVPASNGRLYFAGTVDRTSGPGGAPTGSGIGYFEPPADNTSDGIFRGHHRNLAHLRPRGLLVFPEHQCLVFSGKLIPNTLENGQPATEARLIFYDLDLNERENGRRRVAANLTLQSTGELFPVPSEPGQFVGLIEEPLLVYRYDVESGLIASSPIDAGTGPLTNEIVASTADREGTIWVIIGDRLVRIDPLTLNSEPRRTVPAGVTVIEWLGEALYYTMGGPGLLAGTQLAHAGPV